MARKPGTKFATADEAIGAALAKRSGGDLVMNDAIEKFGTEAMGGALAERLIAPNTPSDQIARLAPWTMLTNIPVDAEARLEKRTLELARTGDTNGLTLLTCLVLAGLDTGRRIAADLPVPVRDELANGFAKLAAQFGAFDANFADRLTAARQAFIEAGAQPRDSLAQVLNADAAPPRPRRKPESDGSAPDKPAKGLHRHYEIEIKLKGAKPAPWRRFLLNASASWQELHAAIQRASGSWRESHLWAIHAGTSARGELLTAMELDNDDWAESMPAQFPPSAKMAQIVERDGQRKFLYMYDFGDCWEVTVTVRQIVDQPERVFRRLLGGALAFPPEDCGGIWGYQECVHLLCRDPATDDGDDAQRRGWLGGWRPDRFDFDRARLGFEQVRRPGPRRVWMKME